MHVRHRIDPGPAPERRRWAARLGATALCVGLLTPAAPAAAQSEPGGSGVVRPPVLVTGDSLSHQAADDIAASLSAAGYDDVRFAVYGGTTVGWSTDRVREGGEPIVVFASGTYNALGGWTSEDDEQARGAVDALADRRCAIWLLPAAARYPGGTFREDTASMATVDGIRRAVTGSPIHLAEWDLVAHALPEIHVADGVHLDDNGQALYGAMVASSVRHRCEDPDLERTAAAERYAAWTARVLLGREPTPEEHASWSDRLLAGHPRLAHTRVLAGSAEWAGSQVDDLYRRAFGRDADPGGRAYWQGLLVSGLSLDEVAAHVFGSEELLHRAGGTPEGLVETLYRQLLHREPDPAGREFWLRHLAGGTPRSVIAGAFHRSPESRGDRVDALYLRILGRDPEPAGRSAWTDALAQLNDLRLAALLASSEEAFQRAQSS